jgi:hypothetical protein
MNERELQGTLRDILEALKFARVGDPDDEIAEFAERTQRIRNLCTFSDAGVLTINKGLVIETDDGGEYQITVARSK